MNKIDLTEWSKRNAVKGEAHMAKRNAVKGEDMVFRIEPYEQKTLNEWVINHNKNCNLKHKVLTFCFTNTGIGQAIIVQCTCGDEVNITDYAMW